MMFLTTVKVDQDQVDSEDTEKKLRRYNDSVYQYTILCCHRVAFFFNHY